MADCVNRGIICVPRGDDQVVTLSAYDADGDELDLSTATEIVFIVAEGILIGGNMCAGGEVLVDKRLTTSGITVLGTDYQIEVSIAAADTADFVSVNNYYEAAAVMPSGRVTFAAGLFKSDVTMIKDII